MNCAIYKNKENLGELTGQKSGLSLIELLVVMGIGLIVTGVAFSLYRLNSNYYYDTEAAIQQQQNLRFALSSLTSDLRMAGNGMSVLGMGLPLLQAYAPMADRACNTLPRADSLEWFSNCDSDHSPGVRAIFGEDGGESASDIVTIFRAEPEFSLSLGQAASFDPDNMELTLQHPVDVKAVAPGDILGLASGNKAVIMEVKEVKGDSGQTKTIVIKKGGRFTFPQAIPSGFAISNARVYNLKDVSIITYFVDPTQNRLMALYHDQSANPLDTAHVEPIVVADNIEDMQLYYFFDKEDVDNSKVYLDPGISSAKLDNFRVSAVTVGLTAKSNYRASGGGQVRPAMFNRVAGTTRDNYARQTTLETVQLRNSPL